MELDEFESIYDKKANEFDLPKFDLIDNEFEIYDSFQSRHIPTTYVLRNIRRFMIDRFWSAINFLHNILMPDQKSMILMEEASKFSEDEKQALLELIKRLTILVREGLATEMLMSEKEDAQLISRLCSAWDEVRPQLLDVAKKIKQGWMEQEAEFKPQYYG